MFALDREPYPVQERAFSHIFAGDSVLVTVPTGTGKTLMAKAGLFRALQLGQKAIYTTPLRALTEQKYREFCGDFGPENVGFATGDFKVNRDAPIQVEVAEILWNRIFGDRNRGGVDVVVMDEAHYFNDGGRGYVWEQSIIGLESQSQLVLLSATIGGADQFCHWVEMIRKVPMKLVSSDERRVPLQHQYKEEYLIDVVRTLAHGREVPSIIFVFGRERCFEVARLLKSCRRFTSDEEREVIAERCTHVLHASGAAQELRTLFLHGIGIHHAGILPQYRQLVEELVADRLLKFVISTETISAGINLPAKNVLFPSLCKYIGGKARLLSSAEYHQMAGRAGRPQFDREGVAITLAPEEVVQMVRKELKNAQKGNYKIDPEKVRKKAYAVVRMEAQRREQLIWDFQAHQRLVQGEAAQLRSQTRIDAGQVLAIGLADSSEPQVASSRLTIEKVVESLLLPDSERREARKLLERVTDNLRSLGIVDEQGKQHQGEMILQLRGMDGLFVYDALMNNVMDYQGCRELVEFLVDHTAIQRILDRKENEKRRAWIRQRLREKRQEGAQIDWEDVEQEYEDAFPKVPQQVELMHQQFEAKLKHPQLHGGGVAKTIWATIEEDALGFHDFVDREKLAREEGSLFTYLIRVMRFAHVLYEVTGLEDFSLLSGRVRGVLARIDPRLANETL